MSNNRTEMHKFLERLISEKSPEEALAMLKEILVEYFGFGSSIKLDELTIILGTIAKDYNESEPEVKEEEKHSSFDDDLRKKIEEIIKNTPPHPANPPWVNPYNVNPYNQDYHPPNWDGTQQCQINITPELFQTYVSSLASNK